MKEKRRPTGDEYPLNPYVKLSTIIIVITLILAAMWFWGLSIISNLDAFWKIFNSDQESFVTGENTKAPPPPQINPLPGATKEPQTNLSGFSVEGVSVKLFRGDEELESVRADKEGAFAFYNVPLLDGPNRFYIKSDVGNGVESVPSKTITIKYLKKPPKLEVSDPPDRLEIKQKDNTVTVKGWTDQSVNVAINGQKAFVTNDGSFSYVFPLSDGENRITVEAVDEAGNKTTLEKTVIFSRTF